MTILADSWNWLLELILSLTTPIGITEPVLQFMLVSAILGVSIYLTLYTGMFSLANAGFMAIGAYVSVVMTQIYDIPFLVALISGAVVAGIVAIPIGFPVLRLHDIYLAIATIGFSEIVRIFFLNYDKMAESVLVAFGNEDARVRLLNGARGIKGIPKVTETWMLVIFLIVVIYFLIRLHRSRFGRAMAAIRQDERAAANMGIDVVYIKNAVFVMSAILAGAAGAFNGHLTRIVVPDAFDFNLTVDILAYAVLGGTSSWLGPIVGGMVLTALPEVLRFVNEYRGLINGLVLLGVIVYLPGGLVDIDGFKSLFRRKTPVEETSERASTT